MMPSLVTPRALKAVTKEPSERRRTTMSGSDSSRMWEDGRAPAAVAQVYLWAPDKRKVAIATKLSLIRRRKS
jgi:hypothetical protein